MSFVGCLLQRLEIKISLEMNGWIYSTQIQDSIYMGCIIIGPLLV